MKKNARAFIAAVAADPKRQEQAKAFPQPKTEEERDALIEEKVLPMAAEMGFTLTLSDFTQTEMGEVDDSELKAVSGGGGCLCEVVGGGGGTDTNDGKTYGCACVAYGQGGDGRAEDMNCFCVAAGLGNDDTQAEFDWPD